MATKNKSIYAILGILSLSPCSGYDIKKYSDNVLSGFWNENFGHIYPTLKKMLEEGLVEIERGDEKKIRYAITKRGRCEFEAWLSEETVMQPMRSEFLLKLLFSSALPTKDVIHMLKDYKECHERDIEKYLKLQQALQSESAIPNARQKLYNAVLRKGILSARASAAWCDETIESLITE